MVNRSTSSSADLDAAPIGRTTRDHHVELRRWARWVATFIGFPLAGVAARAVAGPIDAAGAAALGGLAGGAVLGAVQVGISGMPADQRGRWVGATAIGFAVGLTTGAAWVGYRTDTASLVAMGAATGAGVGLAQALSVPMRAVDRLLWALATPALWAGGWLISSQVIADADRHHAVLGSSGALVVSALAGVLYAVRRRPRQVTAPAGTSTRSVVA